MTGLVRALLAVLLLAAAPAWAQTGPEGDAEPPAVAEGALTEEEVAILRADWREVQDRAAALLAEREADTPAFVDLRGELATWRETFDEARGRDDARVETIEAELEALGPPPEEGATEPDDIAAQRAELEARLDARLAPRRTAEAAYNAAQGLIAEVDALLAERRSQALIQQETPPLNPNDWWAALLAVGGWFAALGADLRAMAETVRTPGFMRREGLQVLLLLVVALLLVFRSGRWLNAARDRLVLREANSPLARLGLLAISVAKLLLPVAGLAALSRIVAVAGARGDIVFVAEFLVPVIGFVVLASIWLGLHAFPPRPDTPAKLPVGIARRREGRVHAFTLGIVASLAMTVDVMVETDPDVAAVAPSLYFAIAIVGGINLLRLGQLLRSEAKSTLAEQDGGIWGQAMRLLGQALILIGIAAPLAIGLGFVNLGLAVLLPAIASLALLVVIGIAQTVVFDLYALATRRTESVQDALAPTLIAFLLALVAVPLFLLIWGVRPETLAEWWRAFLGGVSIGEFTLSPANLLTFGLVFAAGILIVRLVRGVLRNSVLPKTRLDSGGTNAILSGTSYVGITIAALIAVTTAGIDLTGLAFIAGALTVGLGFGLQNIVQNFVSGIILLIERPIKIGDWIAAGGVEGFVRDISVRSTRIETFDRQDVIVPNADLIANTVTNNTLGDMSGRVLISVGVAYGTDTRRVSAILQEIAEAHPMVVLTPPPLVTFEGFGADSLDFMIRAVLRDVLWKVVVRSDMNHAIAERFAAEGIEIPFAQRDVWLRNPEALQGAAATPDEAAGATAARPKPAAVRDMPREEAARYGEAP